MALLEKRYNYDQRPVEDYILNGMQRDWQTDKLFSHLADPQVLAAQRFMMGKTDIEIAKDLGVVPQRVSALRKEIKKIIEEFLDPEDWYY